MTNNFKNMTDTGLIKKGPGQLKGIIVNSHTGGKISVLDGLTNVSNGVKATAELVLTDVIVPAVHAQGTITASGACVPASHAFTKMTFDGAKENDSFTLSDIVYTLKKAKNISSPYDVLLGDNDEETILNIEKAINGTGIEGTDYGIGTARHGGVVANGATSTTLNITARVPGDELNDAPTIGKASKIVFEDTTLGGGTGSSVAGVSRENAIIKIGDVEYTVVTALSETTGADSIPNQVLWESNNSTFLANLKLAVNKSSGAGKYSTTTLAHPDVVAHTKTSTALLFVAREPGDKYNNVVTSTTLENFAFGATKLADGVTTKGATVTIGGLYGDGVTYTIVSALSETAGASAIPYQVNFGSKTSDALENLKKAIDASGTEGTHYSTGTDAHKYVEGGSVEATKIGIASKNYDKISNLIKISTALTNGAWDSDTLVGGINPPKTIMATVTLPDESDVTTFDRFIRTGNVNFSEGLYFVKEGTINVTFVWY